MCKYWRIKLRFYGMHLLDKLISMHNEPFCLYKDDFKAIQIGFILWEVKIRGAGCTCWQEIPKTNWKLKFTFKFLLPWGLNFYWRFINDSAKSKHNLHLQTIKLMRQTLKEMRSQSFLKHGFTMIFVSVVLIFYEL